MIRSGRGNPLISIVLTTFNSETTISRVLEQIVNQDFPLQHVELIMVDGGSKDSTLDIAREFIEKHRDMFNRLELVVHDKNYGVSRARNDGIRLAKGKYILILDHDVILARDTLRTLYDYLDKSPERVLCVAPLHVTISGGMLTKMYEVIMRERTTKRHYAITSCVLCRSRDLIERVGFYDETLGPPFTIYEDWELAARALSRGYEIHLIGWHKVIHDPRETPRMITGGAKENRIVKLTTRYLSVLRSLLNPGYRYALKKVVKVSPLGDKIRWRLYQILVVLAIISIPAVSMYPLIPLITLALYLTLWADLIRQYWNPRVLHLVLTYAVIALTWRLTRSIMLFIPGPSKHGTKL